MCTEKDTCLLAGSGNCGEFSKWIYKRKEVYLKEIFTMWWKTHDKFWTLKYGQFIVIVALLHLGSDVLGFFFPTLKYHMNQNQNMSDKHHMHQNMRSLTFRWILNQNIWLSSILLLLYDYYKDAKWLSPHISS